MAQVSGSISKSQELACCTLTVRAKMMGTLWSERLPYQLERRGRRVAEKFKQLSQSRNVINNVIRVIEVHTVSDSKTPLLPFRYRSV